MSDTMPQGTNIAVGASVATSSNFSSSYTGAKAVDGVVSLASRWVSSGATPPHWLRVDLGSERVVNGFVVRHAGSVGEPAHYNTRALRIQTATSANGPWTTETTVCNPAQEAVTRRTYATPKTLRHIRLEVLSPGVDNYARIAEFEVYAPPPAPVAAFSGTPLSGKVPLEVSFTDQSSGTITAWSWDFGDGTGSTVRHPSHTYAEPGSFAVTLVVTGPGGSNSLAYPAYVQALPTGADLDGDGDVDQNDFAILQRCLLGPMVQQDPACLGSRLDNDLDVDAADMSILLDCLGSPGVSAPPGCR
jgi:PKD repeat protein